MNQETPEEEKSLEEQYDDWDKALFGDKTPKPEPRPSTVDIAMKRADEIVAKEAPVPEPAPTQPLESTPMSAQTKETPIPKSSFWDKMLGKMTTKRLQTLDIKSIDGMTPENRAKEKEEIIPRVIPGNERGEISLDLSRLNPAEKAEALKIKEELAAMPEAERRGIKDGLYNIGFWTQIGKCKGFAKTFEWLASKKDKNSTTGRFLASLATTYREDERKAQKQLERKEETGKGGLAGAGYLSGHAIMVGRAVGKFFGYTTAIPLTALMGSAFLARNFEAMKTARLKNEEVLEKTRIDQEKAWDEAHEIYKTAEEKKEAGQKVTAEDLKKEYAKKLPKDVLERLGKKTEPGTASAFLEYIFRKNAEWQMERIEGKIETIEKNSGLSEEQKQKEKDFIFEKYKKQLSDYDGMISAVGEIDTRAMLAKYGQTAAKGAMYGMMAESAGTALKGAWDRLVEFFSSDGLEESTRSAWKALEKLGPKEARTFSGYGITTLVTETPDGERVLETPYGKGLIDSEKPAGTLGKMSTERVAELLKTPDIAETKIETGPDGREIIVELDKDGQQIRRRDDAGNGIWVREKIIPTESGLQDDSATPEREISTGETGTTGKKDLATEPAAKTEAKNFVQEFKKGDSVWKVAERQLWETYGDKFNAFNPEQKTYLIDAIKDKIVADPEKFGLKNGVDFSKIQAGQKINLESAFSNNEEVEQLFGKASEIVRLEAPEKPGVKIEIPAENTLSGANAYLEDTQVSALEAQTPNSVPETSPETERGVLETSAVEHVKKMGFSSGEYAAIKDVSVGRIYMELKDAAKLGEADLAQYFAENTGKLHLPHDGEYDFEEFKKQVALAREIFKQLSGGKPDSAMAQQKIGSIVEVMSIGK